MNFVELTLYIITVIIMIATPGPVMILVASSGLKHGYSAALRTILGTNFASLILIALSIFVLTGFLIIDEKIFVLIKLLGSLYILYLGYSILKESFMVKNKNLQSLQSSHGGFKKGFLVGISNPKDIIFFSSFFPQFVGIHHHLYTSLIILVILWIILDFLTLSFIYNVFNVLSQSKIYTTVLKLCGLLLVLIAVYGIYTSIGFFSA